MMRTLQRVAALAIGAALLAACAELAGGPSLAGYPGLQFQLESFYRTRALEENASCTQPQMFITGFDVVEDTASRLVLDVRYRYVDEGMRDFDDSFFPGRIVGRGGGGGCTGWAQRSFVVAKSVGGTDGAAVATSVRSMTGPQRELPPGSVMR
jgi:hypothetical protein